MSETRGIGQPRAYDWRDDALCRRPQAEQFFPNGKTGEFLTQAADAKEFCRRCPVALACAHWALNTRIQEGVWGGLDETQRRRLLRRIGQGDLSTTGIEALIAAAWKKDAADPLIDAYLNRTEQGDDGHVRWTATSSSVTVGTRVITSKQLAFEIGHGREPQGIVRAVCGETACVASEHLVDGVMRWQHDHTTAAA